MTWQDELRRLDAELASGSISHELHRRRREDILAEVSGSPVVSPFASGRDEASGAPQWEAANPAADAALPPGQQPTAPAPVPQQQPQQQPPPPQPQQQPAPAPEPPKVTPASLLANKRPTSAPSPADTELTMPISRYEARAEYPPVPPPSPQRDGSRRTWLLIAAGVFVALVAVIGGAWWFGGIGGDNGTDAAQDNPPAASQDAPPADVKLEDKLPVLPGQQNGDNSTMSVNKGAELGLYPESSADIFTEAGAKEIVYRASTDGDTAYFMLVLPMDSPDGANTVVDRMSELMLGAGFSEQQQATMTGELGERTLNGTWYASGDVAVNLWVSQPTASVSDELSGLAEEAVAEVRGALPQA
ncbi:hypothetical protein [Prauserella cavernicola]|uniref:Flagellar basal body-associated protein FliL n=1 Tax=Prauserella cavernicola TaxID=2800127 RepID=A0A934QRP7_9PSEU|nr:hypothetical protein [Prauserella cavernicola]MBK1784459.1 hypothetical protein [Prauserella cavernicola]